MEELENKESEINNQNEQQSTDDVDKLLDEVYSSKKETQPENKQEEQKPVPTGTQVDGTQTYKINYRGQNVEIPQDKVEQYLSKGWDYETKMRDFHMSKQEIENARAELEKNKTLLESQYSELKQLDDYARQNPEWLETVKSAWQAKNDQVQNQLNNTDPNDPVYKRIQEIESRYSKQQEFIDNLIKREETELRAKRDAELDSKIMEIKNKYSWLDWNSKENGSSLEYKIVDHALKNGINDPEAALLHLKNDDIFKKIEMAAKSEVGERLKETKKLGLGPITKEPTMNKLKESNNIRNKSYRDLTEEALAELGHSI